MPENDSAPVTLRSFRRDPSNTEQVDVIKDPSSTHAGRGSTGGTSKMPHLKNIYHQLSLQWAEK